MVLPALCELHALPRLIDVERFKQFGIDINGNTHKKSKSDIIKKIILNKIIFNKIEK